MKTPISISLTCLALAIALPGASCVDPAGKLDDFYEASDPFRLTVVTAPCSERVNISGEYLLSISAVVKPAAPILLAATITVDDTVEPWTINVAMTPLAVADRGLVGDPLEASGTINEDGTFSVDFGSVAVLGVANAILPGVNVQADLMMAGCTNGEGFSCGTVDGAITAPASLPLVGSTYGAVGVTDDLLTVGVIAACPK